MQLNKRNTFSVRYEVLRGGGVVGTLTEADPAVIQCDTDTALVMSVQGVFFDDFERGTYNFLTDRLRPVAIINGVEYPAGVFVITTEERAEEKGVKTVKLAGYSLLYLARIKKTETRLSIPEGANYISEITALLSMAGITAMDVEKTDYTFSTAREDWDIGTSILEIVNALLDEISYNPASIDLTGTVVLRKYQAPTIEQAEHVYTAGVNSIITGTNKSLDDRYGKCNVFRLVCNNPDMDEPMVAVSVNDSASSPFSTVNMGMRILYSESVDNVPTLEALQERADTMRDKSMQTTETVTFYTAIAPDHEPFCTVAIQTGSVSGIFTETAWEMTLDPEEDMKHTARRIIQ